MTSKTTDIETLISRIAALEERAAHQDQTVEDLNAAITGQWQLIDRLKREVERLGAELQELGEGVEPGKEPPPPHY